MSIFIKPQYDRVLVELVSDDDIKSPGGLYLPESMKQSPMGIGIVRAVGEGKYDNGIFIVPKAQIGQKIMFSKFSGVNIDSPIGWENYMIIRDFDIIAVIEENTNHDPEEDTLIEEEPENNNGN